MIRSRAWLWLLLPLGLPGCRREPSSRALPPPPAATAPPVEHGVVIEAVPTAVLVMEAVIRHGPEGSVLVALLPWTLELDSPFADRSAWLVSNPGEVVAYLSGVEPFQHWGRVSADAWTANTSKPIVKGAATRDPKVIPSITMPEVDALLAKNGLSSRPLADQAFSPDGKHIAYLIGQGLKTVDDGPIIGDATFYTGPFHILMSELGSGASSVLELGRSADGTSTPSIWWSDDSKFLMVTTSSLPAMTWILPVQVPDQTSPKK
jgi:hypothetical protein